MHWSKTKAIESQKEMKQPHTNGMRLFALCASYSTPPPAGLTSLTGSPVPSTMTHECPSLGGPEPTRFQLVFRMPGQKNGDCDRDRVRVGFWQFSGRRLGLISGQFLKFRPNFRPKNPDPTLFQILTPVLLLRVPELTSAQTETTKTPHRI